MAIHSIRIKNLLSFDDIIINEIKDINCIVGKNNVGKSNLLKILKYFYAKLDGSRELPPELNSKYNSYGSITVRYDTTRIKKIVTGKNNRSPFLRHIYNTLFKEEKRSSFFIFGRQQETTSYFDITLNVYNDDSVKWSVEDQKVREIISILYPFFDVETRHIDLYDWDRVWKLISQLSSFNVKRLSNEDVVEYLDGKISNGAGSYKDYINKVESIIDTKTYSYRDRVLSYIKVGLKGHDFLNIGEDLTIQSDGTNSHKFIEILLKLLIVLTRREYITPIIYIDEPEVGLHPKLNENLISTLHDIYTSYEKKTSSIEKGKYKTPYPKIIFATHSPNILKHSVRLFRDKQQVIHFSKDKSSGTRVNKLNSQYKDTRFLNVFSDNEARLFFSNYILFVEGATELEVFCNYKLCKKFNFLNDIDVYETNEVTLKYLNPFYSKAAIPFQILYDSDVLIVFDYAKEKLTLNNSKIKLNNYKEAIKCSFFSRKMNEKKYLLNKVVELDGKNIKFNNYNTSFDKFSINKYVRAINEVLEKDNITLTYTTIEGALINEKSLHLFERWICHKFINEMNYNGSNPNPTRMFSAYEKSIRQKKKTNTDIVNSILTTEYGEINLSKSDEEFINRITKAHLRDCKRKVLSSMSSENDILNLYRVVFEGKTDTLLSRKNDKYTSTIDQNFRTLVKEVRTNHLQSLAPLMGKTGGWVTDYLDFAIDEIERNSHENNDFYRNFSFIFPELSDILRKVSSAIA
ncbi:retron Eco8 family effector endonuclease [Vibrio fluvialis]|nr:retron Eco8 family effector endonuclease [Vibrio fluvialis]MBY7870198.1 retron Eco8 family effector endonuclease [Vibrio fluvialis]